MDASDKSIPDLVKSWMIPWRSDRENVSRDFWMPDHSCRVCYECDSQFTLFNRRHHCRLCGRVFCAKCTTNWVSPPEPRSAREDCEKIRVCNYCFNQWEHGLVVNGDNGAQIAGQDFNSSPSASSTFISTNSEAVFESSSIYFGPMPLGSDETVMEARSDVPVEVDQSLNQFGLGINRSDDEDDEFDIYQLETIAGHFPQLRGYYGPTQFDDIDYGSHKLHLEGELINRKSLSSSPSNNYDSEDIKGVEQLVKKEDVNLICDECEAPSSLYAAEDVDVQVEPVDFENSGVLWLPPEPEDEEDEKEPLLFDDDDDDDGDAAGEWGYLRSSNSFGSGESRSRDRPNEEHKNVMKNVVDGHFRALVAQLLQVENLPMGEDGEKENWLEIIASLCWEATSLLKPDTSTGGGMDPGGYVKIKCLASGRPSQSVVVKGVVCKKNVANKRMSARIEKARFLILGGALEYQRVSNQLSSFDTLLQQEMDHLKMAVAKIDAHNPNVLLVEKSVSRHAQEYLRAKNISLVLNVKRSLLERIARCTGGQIVPSIDHLSSQKLGYCDMFHVERFLEEHGSAAQGGKKLLKTLMFIEGCPKPLGCTILLRGASGDDLKKVKHVIQYAVFAAYHLALETSFLADEGASLPELPLNTPITVALPKPSTADRSISTIPGYSIPANEKVVGPNSCGNSQRSNSNPLSDVVSVKSNASIYKTEAAVSPAGSQYTVPSCTASFPSIASSRHGVSESREKTLVGLKMSSQTKSYTDNSGEDVMMNFPVANGFALNDVQNDYSIVAKNQGSSNPSFMQPNSKNGTNEQVPAKEEFPPSPSDNQSILVSLSSRCVWKGTVCERSVLFRIKYYGNFDKPLGRFLRDHLFDQNYRCRSCAMPSEAHVQCYTHRQGTLTISVKKLPEFLLPGEREGKIWMWHRCLRCPRTNGFPPSTRRIVMSDAAWGLSFGKFLELSFSNHAAASRVASCGHSLHRDCLRFYGFGNMVACFRYASIDVLSVFLPPSKLHFNYDRQEWILEELNEVVVRAEVLFSEVLKALHQMAEKRSGESLLNSMKLRELRRKLTDLEGMLHREKEEFEDSLQKISNREAKEGQPVIDILEINRLRRQLLFQSFMWDHRLIYVAGIDSNNISEDDRNDYNPEHVEGNLGKLSQSCDDSTLANAKSNGSHVLEGEVLAQKGVVERDSDQHVRNKSQSNLSAIIMNSYDESDDDLDAIAAVRRTLSDGQVPIMKSLSDSLDAAWTGHVIPGITIANDIALSESTISEKLDLEEDHSGPKGTRSPLALFSKGSDIMEDGVSWLRMPFINFYRSLNKNFTWGAQKLDSLSEYNPVFVSTFRETELQGGARLLLPVGVHDTVVPVFDDEPTSIISYALLSPDYVVQLSEEFERPKDIGESPESGGNNVHSFFSIDEMTLESFKSLGSADDSILSMSGSRATTSLVLDPMSYTKSLHAKISFSDNGPLGQVKYTVTCYYARCFEALRKISCPTEMDFVRSLSRCKKWGAQGGKSNVFFAKTLDDRFIIKQVTKTELESFIKFAPGYFKYLSESIGTGSPTCLAKILGIYQIMSKHAKGGKESKMDVLVMENLLFQRAVTRLYDLKGSTRSRYNPDSSGSNKVLLDQNLIEAMPTSPIFVGNKAKRLLERAVWNDTAFLASVDVMDYSLLVGVDEKKHELVLGIIDFMRQYTWDKHLETWVKASGILGGPKNVSPTVISPKQYKKRFRKAMTTYFLMVPDQWSPPTTVPSKSQTGLSCEENNTQGHGGTSAAD